jgi:hypothetical protein
MITYSEILNAAKMVSIQDAVNAAVKASRDQQNLLKLSPIKRFMFPHGKNKIKKEGLNKVVLGMKEIWKELEKCHSKLPENILLLNMDEKRLMKNPANGRTKTQKKGVYMTEQCTPSKQENSFVPINVLDVRKNVFHMHIMRIIQNLSKSFGCVQLAISIIITNQNITLREQARKQRKLMRCSDPKRKPWEICRNDISAYLIRLTSNRTKWQAGGKFRFIYLPPGYNNDPFRNYRMHVADLKSSLIILNSLPSDVEANKVQASERIAA